MSLSPPPPQSHNKTEKEISVLSFSVFSPTFQRAHVKLTFLFTSKFLIFKRMVVWATAPTGLLPRQYAGFVNDYRLSRKAIQLQFHTNCNQRIELPGKVRLLLF